MTFNTSKWMKQLPADAVITNVLMPGSHDSAAYEFCIDRAKFGNTRWQYWAEKFHRLPCVKSFLERWTWTQDLDIYEQLELGVRALDFRVSYCKDDSEFYFTHSFACVPAKQALVQVKNFLRKHPTEIVYVRVEPDVRNYKTMLHTSSNFLIMASNILKDFLVPFGTQDLTLRALRENDQRLFLFYKHAQNLLGKRVWPSSFHGLEQYTSDVGWKKNIIERYLEYTEDRHELQKLNVLAMTLTPQDQDVENALKSKFCCCCCGGNKTPKNGGLPELAREMHAVMYQWMWAWDLENVQVLDTDFVDARFIRFVEKLNRNRFSMGESSKE